MGIGGMKRAWLCGAACATAIFLAAQGAYAQGETVETFAIPAEPLSEALNAFASKTGLQLAYPAELTTGLKSRGLNGNYEASEALRLILGGSGLTFHFANATTIVIEKPDTHGARALGPVEVQGAESVAANGSTDPTATEGTGSYTSTAVTVGSKAPLSIRETPQNVSVMTQQQMQDQHLDSIADVLNQMPGVTIINNDGNVDPSFYSRGYEITNFQVDGGSPLSLSNEISNAVSVMGFSPAFDMAEYDHVELLQGPDGLFSGSGNPSGTINLDRKRPLDHNQVSLEAAGGSWNNYRTVIDLTGPLDIADFGDKIRGRLVASYQSQDYFYQTASSNHFLLYGIVEADLTPTTLLTVGGSFTQRNAVPWFGGLPRYANGDDLHLPVDTSFALPWNRYDTSTPEIFVELNQKLAGDWTAHVNLTDTATDTNSKYGYVYGAVTGNPATGSNLEGYQSKYVNRQYLADAEVTGSFDLFNRHHELTAGASYGYVSGVGSQIYPDLYSEPYSAVDVSNFDPGAWPEPASQAPYQGYDANNQSQWRAYMTLRLELLHNLHLTGGFSLNTYDFKEIDQPLDANGHPVGPPSDLFNYGDHSVTIPYGAVTYDIDESWSTYFSYNKVFQDVGGILQGPPPGTPVPPILGANYDAGVKGELLGGALNATLSFYRTNETNYPTILDPNYPPILSGVSLCCELTNGDFKSEGLEADVAGQILPGWQVSTSFTYNYNAIVYDGGSNDTGQAFSTQTPKYLFKLWTTYRLPDDFKRWQLGFGVNAQSAAYYSGEICEVYRPAPSTSCKTEVPYKFNQPGYGVFGASIAYDIDDHWHATLNVDNLLDKTYYQTVGTSASGNWYGNPRNFMFTVRYAN
jgi:outer-membrane receptor for ferric coprogen and ferric-rhodotorulic acid